MENLVLYGGSFDPIHNGHLRIARAAALRLNADVIFVPSKAQKNKTPIANEEDRLEMLRLALKEDGSPNFSISLIELQSRDDVTYWVDTLAYFREKYPKRNLYFLLGADAVNSFPNWKEAKRCAELAKPLFVSRPGIEVNDDTLKEYGMMRLPYEGSGKVSSSDVRTLRSMDIPLSVRSYIEERQLYYFRFLAPLISPKRLKHSISVANLCYMIAKKNHLEGASDLYIAGLLHDCGKNCTAEDAIDVVKEATGEYFDRMPPWTYHQYMGKEMAKEIFGVHNEAVLDAIACHATGKPSMSPLAKILYSADKTDPLRGYDSSKLIKQCCKDYHLGFLSVLSDNKDYYLRNGYKIDNPLTIACMKRYLGE